MFTKFQVSMLIAFTMMVGFMAAFALSDADMSGQVRDTASAFRPMSDRLDQLQQRLDSIGKLAEDLSGTILLSRNELGETRAILSMLVDHAAAMKAGDEEQREQIEQLLVASHQQGKRSQDALEMILTRMLGDPIGQTFGERSTIKVFSLEESGYRGYMAKVKLHDPEAVRLTLSGGQVGHRGETTSAAAKRTGAALAVNGGGFTRQDGVLYPIGITVVDGEIKTFYQTDLSFIGFDSNGRLVGGEVTSRERIKELDIRHGASFVPTLLQNGEKQPIPAKWANRREPRTLIGHFSNGDLLFIVIDGRQKGYSEGVTLEEAQDKLLEFNVRDAYNLDGGGSSTFYYNGKVLNSPSDGRQRSMPTHIVILP